MSVKNAPFITAALSATLVITLSACDSKPELDMTQAGYAEANECYVAMSGFTFIGEQAGAETYIDGPINATKAIKEIAAGIGIDDAQLKADSAANKDKIRAIIAKGNADFGDPVFTAARNKAEECGKIYE